MLSFENDQCRCRKNRLGVACHRSGRRDAASGISPDESPHFQNPYVFHRHYRRSALWTVWRRCSACSLCNRVTDDTRTFKANISAVFVVENTFRLITYSLLGLFTADILKRVCILISFALLGLYGGIKSASVLDDKIVKKIVIILLILSGISLIATNL